MLATARVYADRPDRREETGTDVALDRLRRLSAAQWRQGHVSIASQSFGQRLADVVGTKGMRGPGREIAGVAAWMPAPARAGD